MGLASHLILRLRDDRVLAPSVAARRLLARTVLRLGQDSGLLAFRAADTHLHAVALVEEAAGRQLARRIEIALVRGMGLPIGFAPARVLPVRDQPHLVNLFGYILGQARHHGLEPDALHEAGNLPDLLGMRLAGAYTVPRVREHLPRLRRGDLLRHLGLDTLPEQPLAWEGLADAAAAAVGLPSLDGRTEPIVAARRAAVHAAREALSTEQTALRLGLSARAVTRMRSEVADPALILAIRRQLAVREALGEEVGRSMMLAEAG